MTARPAPGAEQIKNCCAATYGQDAVALLLGDAYHPGGQALTERLADALGLRAGQHVVDIACGPGTTARLLATHRGVHVTGIELNQTTVDTARVATAETSLSHMVGFQLGDAERIPLPDGLFDAVVCECAFCTFPDKPTAAAELARVLKPGGRAGITDITAHPDGLPDELTGLGAWIACIADARPVEDYAAVLAAAGLRTIHTERHDHALRTMIDTIEARLKLLRMTAPEQLANAGTDLDAALRYTRLAAGATANGTLGYALLTAEKPT